MSEKSSKMAKQLKEVRKSRGLTQEQVAEALRVSVGTISGYERGYRRPDPDMIVQLADLYDVSTDYILGRHTITQTNVFGQKIREMRISKELTPDALSKSLDISSDILTSYEAGTRTPDLYIAEKLATYFGVSVDYLLGRTNNSKGILKDASNLDIEYILMNNLVTFNGDVLTEEEKEDVLNFIRHVLRRERSEEK